MGVSGGGYLCWCGNYRQAVWVPLVEEQLATVTHCWAGCFSLLEIGECSILEDLRSPFQEKAVGIGHTPTPPGHR